LRGPSKAHRDTREDCDLFRVGIWIVGDPNHGKVAKLSIGARAGAATPSDAT
jgi:hypothetical protein